MQEEGQADEIALGHCYDSIDVGAVYSSHVYAVKAVAKVLTTAYALQARDDSRQSDNAVDNISQAAGFLCGAGQDACLRPG